MTRLPGRPARFTDDDPVETSRQLGGLLRELHTIAFDTFGYIETGVTSPVPPTSNTCAAASTGRCGVARRCCATR